MQSIPVATVTISVSPQLSQFTSCFAIRIPVLGRLSISLHTRTREALASREGEVHARVIATGVSQTTHRPFNLMVGFESALDKHGNMLGRAVAESSFHHFADYNWDISKGCPSFLTEPPGDQIRNEPEKLDDVKTYVRNVALWLANREI